jgi:hypothetical protein
MMGPAELRKDCTMEEIDHVFDWERTMNLRSKPAPRVGQGTKSWAPYSHGLQKQETLRVDTNVDPNYPKSQLQPRIQDRRLYLCRHNTRDQSVGLKRVLSQSCDFDGLSYEKNREQQISFFNGSSPFPPVAMQEHSSQLESRTPMNSLPFSPTKTISLRRNAVEVCSHSPRFQLKFQRETDSNDRSLDMSSSRQKLRVCFPVLTVLHFAPLFLNELLGEIGRRVSTAASHCSILYHTSWPLIH